MADVSITIDVSDAIKNLKALRKEVQETTKVIAQLRDMQQEVIITVPYYPHPGQREVHNSNSLTKLVVTGTRWGKDVCCINEGIKSFIERLTNEKHCRMILIAPTKSMTKQLWKNLCEFFPREFVTTKLVDEMVIKTRGNGEVIVASADDVIDCIPPFSVCVISEAARIENFKKLWARVRFARLCDGKSLVLINTTPKKGSDFNRYIKDIEGVFGSDATLFNFPTSDNPHIHEDELEKIRGMLPENVYREQFLGEIR